MGCGPTQPEAPAGAKPGVLMIYGDMFNADTRALIAECRHVNLNHEFVPVDMFKKQHLEPAYVAKNPTKSIPMIVDGNSCITGQTKLLHEWILQKEDARQISAPSQEKQIEGMANYFYRQFRGNTSKLIKRLGMRVLQQQDDTPSHLEGQEKDKPDDLFKELNEQLLLRLNE